MPAEPIIGLTARRSTKDGRFFVNGDYLDAVRAAGGLPLLLPCGAPETAERLLRTVDGLLLTGGPDLAPALYGEAPHPALGPVCEENDRFELALVSAARARRMPVFGICRGLQLLNVAFGGTLFQDIPDQCPKALTHQQNDKTLPNAAHAVAPEAGSALFGILGAERAEVNSFHHQAVKRLGAGLIASAKAPDGVIEAVESPDGTVLAVQWHPERLCADARERALFSDLVRRCK